MVFITEMKSVYSAVQTESLNKAVCASSLKGYFNGMNLYLQFMLMTAWSFMKKEAVKSCEFLTLTFDGSWVTNVQFCYFGTICKKTDNLVSWVTSLLDLCDSIPSKENILLYRNARGQAPGPVQHSVQWAHAAPFLVVKRPVRETNKALTCTIEVTDA